MGKTIKAKNAERESTSERMADIPQDTMQNQARGSKSILILFQRPDDGLPMPDTKISTISYRFPQI